MTVVSGFIIISVLISLLFMIGFLNLMTNHDENRCEMTYMFEYPQFVRVYVPQNEQFQRYNLYAYSEGRFTEQTREMKFSGVPVLFIPGNGGSYKQARSLASVALRKALSSRFGFHLDFFTVDLNEELSGLSGSVLSSQVEFVQHCLYRILELYHNKPRYVKPNSVIIIGHSMGGLIAQSILSDPGNAHISDLIITLSSPHTRPSLVLDYDIFKFYQNLNNATMGFSQKIKANDGIKMLSDNDIALAPYLRNKTIITVGGGHNDKLVNSALTNYKLSTIHVLTDAIPTVWLSTDHACIVWCKQLVLTLIRALFGVIDSTTNQLTMDSDYRKAIFSHYLINNNGIKPIYQNRYKDPILINPIGEWIEKPNRQKSLRFSKGISSTTWFMARLIPGEFNYKHLFVQAINLENADWIFACSANYIRGDSRICEDAIHLSQYSRIAPSHYMKRKILSVDLEALHELHPSVTHVVARVLPTSEFVQVDMDHFDPALRELNITVPSWYSLSNMVIITETVQSALYYKIRLYGFDQLYQAFLLHVEVNSCSQPMFHASVNFSVPWAVHHTYGFFTEKEKKPMSLKLHSSKPYTYYNETASIELIFDSSCRYTVSIHSSIIDSVTQIVRHYSPMLIANIGASLLLALRWQLITTSENIDGNCPPLHSALASAAKPYYLVTMAKLAGKVLSWKSLSSIGLIRPDLALLSDSNMDFLLLPLILYATSVGLMYTVSVALWAAVIFCGSATHKLALRFLARTIAGSLNWSDWLLSALHRVPCFVAVCFVALIFSTCGALGLVLGAMFYFLKLTKMYEDYLEELVIISVKIVAKKIKRVVRSAISSKTQIDMDKNNDEFKSDNTLKEEDEKKENCNVNEVNMSNSVKLNINKSQLDVNDELDNSKNNEDCIEETGIVNKECIEEYTKSKETDKTGKSESNINTESDNSEIENQQVDTFCSQDSEISNSVPISDKESSNNPSSLSTMHFHFTGFLIWLLIALLNIPSLLTWAHNFKYSSVLQPDPTFLPGFIMCIFAGLLWQIDIPKQNLKYYKELGALLYLLAMINLLYTPISLYRLSYTMAAGIVLVTLHQMLAPIIDSELISEDRQHSESVSDILQQSITDDLTDNSETDDSSAIHLPTDKTDTDSVEELMKKKDLIKSKME